MSGLSRVHTAALVALGLTCQLFPAPHCLGDARLIVMGRLHLWPQWPILDEEQRACVTAFLGQRPEALAELKVFEQTLDSILRNAEDFEFCEEGASVTAGAGSWERKFRVVPGRPLDQRLEEWLESLRTGRRIASTATVEIGNAEAINLETGSGLSFRIPIEHLPREPATERLKLAQPLTDVQVNSACLESLADQIDQGQLHYRRTVIDHFLPRLRSLDGEAPPETLSAGTTSLLIAPTGSGKSVFSRLYALELARQGIPVAYITQDIASVWTEALRLEQAVEAAELDVTVVPLSSWRSTADHLADHLSRSVPEDPQGLRMLDQLGYTCLLSAYSTAEPPEYGEEPCKQLRQRLVGSKRERAVECPFAGACGRFSAFHSALSADVVVVNHHAFLAGRVPFPVQDDQGLVRNITILELVLSRAAVLLIDEVDALQSVAVGQVTRGLSLSSRGGGGANLFYQLASEVDGRRGPTGLKVRSFERARSALLRIANEAERLTELVDRAELAWPREGVTWREGYDPWLATQLFDEQDNRFDLLRRLYDAEPITEDAGWEALRRVLYPLAGPGLGNGREIEDIKADLDNLFTISQVCVRQADRDRLIKRLVLRATLLQLDRALRDLRPQLPELEQQEIALAGQLRDALLGYAPWSPSPSGALGRRLYGYRLNESEGQRSVLLSQILGGDPHGMIAELGSVVSEALVGTPRIVLALSATGRFYGSPGADVLGDVWAYIEDEDRNVAIRAASVDTRISGQSDYVKRRQAAVAVTRELWHKMLAVHLESAMQDPALEGRRRVLLVTGSYAEAEAVKDTLSRLAGPRVTVKRAVPDRSPEQDRDDTLGRRELESFGSAPEPAVLIAPLSVVARGLNILKPGGDGESALSSIFVLTRPVPPAHSAEQMLRHVSYNARRAPAPWRGAMETVEDEMRWSWQRVGRLKRSHGAFSRMDPELRRELVCDVLVELIQLAGRGRRGRTPVTLYFVDAAFEDPAAAWRSLTQELLVWWQAEGVLEEMERYHGAFIHALAKYAGLRLQVKSEIPQ